MRELRNVITDAISVLGGQVLDADSLPPKFMQCAAMSPPPLSAEFNRDSLQQWQTLPGIKDAEQFLIDEALRRSNGNQTIAAQLLGMTRSALNKRLTRAKQEQE